MGIAVQLLDAVETSLNAASLPSSAVVSRMILPKVEKHQLTVPQVIVSLVEKSPQERDRRDEWLTYQIGVSVIFNTDAVSDLDDALDLVEAMQDWLADEDNRKMTLTSDCATLVLPYETNPFFDVDLLRDTGIFMGVTLFNYNILKTRT